MIKIIVYTAADAIYVDHHYVNDISDLHALYNEAGVVFSEKEFIHPAFGADGKLREMTPDELKIKGIDTLVDGELIIDGVISVTERPDRAHSWNGAEWVFDTAIFEHEQNLAYDRLKNSRENAFEIGVMLDEMYLVKSRTQDLTDAGAVFNQFMAGVIVTSEWHHSNGLIETINKDRFLAIYQAVGAFRSAQFKKEGTLRALVASATTIAELDGIVW